MGACAHAGLLRGGLERDVVHVVGTARLVVVDAVAVRLHACAVHCAAALEQDVVDAPVGEVELTVAVLAPVGELSGVRVPGDPRGRTRGVRVVNAVPWALPPSCSPA